MEDDRRTGGVKKKKKRKKLDIIEIFGAATPPKGNIIRRWIAEGENEDCQFATRQSVKSKIYQRAILRRDDTKEKKKKTLVEGENHIDCLFYTNFIFNVV